MPEAHGEGAETVLTSSRAAGATAVICMTGACVQQPSRDHKPEDGHRRKGSTRAPRRCSPARVRRIDPTSSVALVIPRHLPPCLPRILGPAPRADAPPAVAFVVSVQAPPPDQVSSPTPLMPWGGFPGGTDAPGLPGDQQRAAGCNVGSPRVFSRCSRPPAPRTAVSMSLGIPSVDDASLGMAPGLTRSARGSASAARAAPPAPPAAPSPPADGEEEVGEPHGGGDLVGDARAAADAAVGLLKGVITLPSKVSCAANVDGPSSRSLGPWHRPPVSPTAQVRTAAKLCAPPLAESSRFARFGSSAMHVGAPAAHTPPDSLATLTTWAVGQTVARRMGGITIGTGERSTVPLPCGADLSMPPALQTTLSISTHVPCRVSNNSPISAARSIWLLGAASPSALAWAQDMSCAGTVPLAWPALGTVLGPSFRAILGRVTPCCHGHGSAHLPVGPGCLSPDSPGPHGVSPFLSLQADPRACPCTDTGQTITGTSMTAPMTRNEPTPLAFC